MHKKIFAFIFLLAISFQSLYANALNLTLTSPTSQEIHKDEIAFISALVENNECYAMVNHFRLHLPPGWQLVMPPESEVILAEHSSTVLLYGISPPKDVLALEYEIALVNEDSGECVLSYIQIIPDVNFTGYTTGLPETYIKNDPVTCHLICQNKSNIPLTIGLDVITDPPCFVDYFTDCIELPPYESYAFTIHLEPKLGSDDDKQFIKLKLRDVTSCEILHQDTICLDSALFCDYEDDDQIYIPARFSTVALGDNGKHVLALELSGRGFIDPSRKRYLEFFFFLPSDSRNTIYNLYQRLYVGVSEPDWAVNLGDTVYTLSPLTQWSRYGRGAGFDVTHGPWSVGTHYTQNIFNNDYNPRELGSYVEYSPKPLLSFSGNYLHKTLRKTPTSNILTFQTDFALPYSGITEIEIGKNFIGQEKHWDTAAYRIETRGQCFQDTTWYNFEKVYTGPAFYGYYQHLHAFSGTVDFPVLSQLRANISYSRFTQNYDTYKATSLKRCQLAPRQWQYNTTLTYCYSNVTLAVNGLLLRSKDLGFFKEYDFFQKWAGANLFINYEGYNFNILTSFGQQHDYLTNHTSHFLQRYYVYLGKQLFQNCSTSLFWEAGNINYYDARPWRFGYGGSVCYQYSPRGRVNFFAQRFKNTAEKYNLTQYSMNLMHTFRNQHNLEVLVQYFHYQKHYHNDALFLVSYSVPFNAPAGRRNDIGEIDGCVYDTWNQCMVPEAIVQCNETCNIANEQGLFAFSRVPRGENELQVDRLPPHLITQYSQPQCVSVEGRRNASVCIPVVPACSIQGSVILRNTYHHLDESYLEEGLSDIQVIIALEQSDEIYSVYTDAKGYFKFPKLRPGIWHIYVPPEQLPAYHTLKPEEFIIAISPAENKYVSFDVEAIKPTYYQLY